jgi:hypothetical protein
MDSPICGNEKRGDKLKTVLPPLEETESEDGDEKVCAGGDKRGQSGRRAGENQDRSGDWAENDE